MASNQFQLSFLRSDVGSNDPNPNQDAPPLSHIANSDAGNISQADTVLLWIGDGTSVEVTLWFYDTATSSWIRTGATTLVTSTKPTHAPIPYNCKLFAQLTNNIGGVTTFGMGFLAGDQALQEAIALISGGGGGGVGGATETTLVGVLSAAETIEDNTVSSLAELVVQGDDIGATRSLIENRFPNTLGPFGGLKIELLGTNQVMGVWTRNDKTATDAYGAIRATTAITILEYGFPYGLSADDVGSITVGGGVVTWDTSRRMAALTVTSASGDSARIGSHRSTLAERSHSGGPTIHVQMGPSHANTRYFGLITDTARQYGFGVMEQGGTIYIAIFHPLAGGIALIPSSAWNITSAAAMGLTSLSNTVHTIYGHGSGDGGFGTMIYIDGVPVHAFGSSPSPLVFPNFAWRVGGLVENIGPAVNTTMWVKSAAFTIWSSQAPKLRSFTISLGTPKNVGTTRTPLYAFRPRDQINGFDNPLSLFPSRVRAIVDTGNITIELWHQKGGVDPLGGGAWTSPAEATYEVNNTPNTFTPNASTQLVGTCPTSNPVEDLTGVFGPNNLGAIKKRFGGTAPTNLEMFIVTARAAASTHPVDALTIAGQQVLV